MSKRDSLATPAARGAISIALAAALVLLAASVRAPAPARAAPPPADDPESGYLKWPDDLAADKKKICLDAEKAWKAAEARPTLAALEGAIAKLEAAQKAARTCVLPLHYLGIAFQFTGDYDDARRVLKQAVELSPRAFETVLELANNYCHLREWKSAEKWYDKTIELAPTWAEPYKRRAILLHVGVGDADAALADVDRAEKITPKDDELPALRDQIKRAFKGPDWPTRFEAQSEHYSISTNVSQEFADMLAHRAELIHHLYQKVFGEEGGKGRKFPIIVYASNQEYHANGGPEGAGGHYSPQFRSLELFQYPDPKDTLIVLHHEGFHQFFHTFLDDAPQWFNEGLGDYFGPSELVTEGGKESYKTASNPWRLDTIKRAIRSGEHPAIADLMLMTQQEMYSGDAGLHYAMAWSLVYLCCERRDEKGKFVWFPVLKDYLKELKKGSGQRKAFDRSFGKIDMAAFTQDWRQFILGVRG